MNIRTRLTLAFVGVLALVVLLYSTAAIAIQMRQLRAQLVRHAIQDVETVEGLLYFAPNGKLVMNEEYHNHPESKKVLERLLEVRSPSGDLLLRNELLGARSLGERMLPNEGVGGYSQREFTLADGTQVQMVSRRHDFRGRPAIIRIAYDETPLWAQIRSSVLALILPLPVIVALAWLAGYWLAGSALRPIQNLAKRAGEITSDRLHERLPVNKSDGELADLATSFNEVLTRLERAFDRLRRFTSDASHELRTPLAAMRSVGEVGLQRRKDADGYRDVIGSMLEEANRLTQLVENLLTIARADAGQIRLNTTDFHASGLAHECGSLFEAVLDESQQKLTILISQDSVIHGDWLLLRQALLNILHNAIKFSPAGGEIELRVSHVDGQAIFEVRDQGPGIPAEDLDRIFDRFYRVDESRSRVTDGTGLGLSIARWNIEIHKGQIRASSDDGVGATLFLAVPAQKTYQLPPGALAGVTSEM